MRPLVISLLMAVATICTTQAQQPVSYTPADSLFVVSALASAARQPEGTCLPVYFARQLKGRPYVGQALERFPDREQLIVNTRQLDCTTLVETATALTLCARQSLDTFADYCHMLQTLRYRGGTIDGYASRLHYFSDWIADNTQRGLVAEVQTQKPPFTATQQLSIDYMSRHPQAYPALKRHPEMTARIARQEQALTGRKYRYIPKNRVDNSQAMRQAVHDGDIIAITCNKPGLDIAHVGFAVWHNDGLHLLNASSIHKKVVEEPMTLAQYLKKHPSHTGIRIVRIKKQQNR